MALQPPDPPRSTHILRPDLASDQVALLAVFVGPELARGTGDTPPAVPRDAARVITRSGQRTLQQLFRTVYTTPTFSNNNAWLRRKLLEGACGKRRDRAPLASWPAC